MKNPNIVDLMIAKSFDLLFRSHEIRPHDHSPNFILLFAGLQHMQQILLCFFIQVNDVFNGNGVMSLLPH